MALQCHCCHCNATAAAATTTIATLLLLHATATATAQAAAAAAASHLNEHWRALGVAVVVTSPHVAEPETGAVRNTVREVHTFEKFTH